VGRVSDDLVGGSGRAAEVIARHESALMRRANVVAIAEGQNRGETNIIVYVARKVPREQLAEDDLLPPELEGIPVDVVESGPIDAQSR
jgi:hypothetical protein